MQNTYYGIIFTVEHIYRLFSEIMKKEIEKMKASDINVVQALMVYNISDNELTIGEISSRGMYQGSNVSYNLKQLIKNNYVVHVASKHDKRSFFIKLSEKGIKFREKINFSIEEQSKKFEKDIMKDETMESIYKNLQNIEIFLLKNVVL